MNKKLSIIFFGDSLTFGYGIKKENSWVYKTVSYLGLNNSYLNKAQNGDTTPSMLSRYYNDVLIYKPSKIFIMGGTNDLLLGRTVESIIQNIEIMIKDAQNINAEIIIGIPPTIIGEMANELFMPSSFYNYAQKELSNLKDKLIYLCKTYNVKFINFYGLNLNHKDLYLDGIHLNPIGNQLMYESAKNILISPLKYT